MSALGAVRSRFQSMARMIAEAEFSDAISASGEGDAYSGGVAVASSESDGS